MNPRNLGTNCSVTERYLPGAPLIEGCGKSSRILHRVRWEILRRFSTDPIRRTWASHCWLDQTQPLLLTVPDSLMFRVVKSLYFCWVNPVEWRFFLIKSSQILIYSWVSPMFVGKFMWYSHWFLSSGNQVKPANPHFFLGQSMSIPHSPLFFLLVESHGIYPRTNVNHFQLYLSGCFQICPTFLAIIHRSASSPCNFVAIYYL